MNQEAIGGGIGAIFGGLILQRMIEIASAGSSIASISWMPPLLVILGVFVVIAGIFGVE